MFSKVFICVRSNYIPCEEEKEMDRCGMDMTVKNHPLGGKHGWQMGLGLSRCGVSCAGSGRQSDGVAHGVSNR